MVSKPDQVNSMLERNKKNTVGFYSMAFDDHKGFEALKKYSGSVYKQHNPNVEDNKEGFIKHTKWVEAEIPHKEKFVHVIAEDNYVVLHVVHQRLPDDVKTPEGQAPDYLSYSLVSFDLFKLDDNGKLIEHWDAMQFPPYPGKALGSHKMADGETEIKDLDKTDENKSLVKSFIKSVLIGGNLDLFPDYFNDDRCTQHNMYMEDGASGWVNSIKNPAYDRRITYNKLYRMVAEGNFVWTMCEATFNDLTTVVMDLFRVEEGKIAEHWDVLYDELPETPKNNNTLF